MRLLLTGFTLLIALVLLAPVGDAFAPKLELHHGVGPVSGLGRTIAHHQRHRGAPTSTVSTGSKSGSGRGGSQDVTVGTFRSGRTVRFVYTPATDVTQPTAHPAERLAVRQFLRQHPQHRVDGRRRARRSRARSFDTAVGYFRWLGAPNPGTGATTDPSYGSQAVVVTRNRDRRRGKCTRPTPPSAGSRMAVPIPMTYYAGNLADLAQGLRPGTRSPRGPLSHAVRPDRDVPSA